MCPLKQCYVLLKAINPWEDLGSSVALQCHGEAFWGIAPGHRLRHAPAQMSAPREDMPPSCTMQSAGSLEGPVPGTASAAESPCSRPHSFWGNPQPLVEWHSVIIWARWCHSGGGTHPRALQWVGQDFFGSHGHVTDLLAQSCFLSLPFTGITGSSPQTLSQLLLPETIAWSAQCRANLGNLN